MRKISAVTLETKDIESVVQFYKRMDFILQHRKGVDFVSLSFGECFLNFVKNKNLIHPSLHGRIIFYVGNNVNSGSNWCKSLQLDYNNV